MEKFLEQVKVVMPVTSEWIREMVLSRGERHGFSYPVEGGLPHLFSGRNVREGDRVYYGMYAGESEVATIITFIREEIGTRYRIVKDGYFPWLEKIT